MLWVDSLRRLYEGRSAAFQGGFCILCTSRTRAPRISSGRAKDVLLLGHQKSIESYTRFFSYFQFGKTAQHPLLVHLVRHTPLVNPGFHLIYSDVISTLFLSMILSDSIRRPGFHLFAFISNCGTYKKQHSPQCSSPYPSELGNTTPRPSTPFHQPRWYSMKQCPSTDKRW